MRKTILFGGGALALLLGLLLLPGQAHASGCYEDPIYERNLHGRYVQAAFVRDNACMDGTSIIETVSGDTVVEVIAETDGWYKVRTPEGRTGWTGARLMEITSAPISHVRTPSKSAEELLITPVAVPQPVLISQPDPELSSLPCPALQAGQLFRVSGQNAVYLLNRDKKRMYFPNSDVFHSWYNDFSDVREIASKCFDDYPSPSAPPYGVNYRSGARLIKRVGSPNVYVILPGNVRARIANATVARQLYGEDWGVHVRDVADFFWQNYTSEGEAITEAEPHDGMLVQEDGDDTVYEVVDGELEEVEGSIPQFLREDIRMLNTEMIQYRVKRMVKRMVNRILENPAGDQVQE